MVIHNIIRVNNNKKKYEENFRYEKCDRQTTDIYQFSYLTKVLHGLNYKNVYLFKKKYNQTYEGRMEVDI